MMLPHLPGVQADVLYPALPEDPPVGACSAGQCSTSSVSIAKGTDMAAPL